MDSLLLATIGRYFDAAHFFGDGFADIPKKINNNYLTK